MTTEEIRKILSKDWAMQTLDVWRRAGCRCEYCGKSLTENPDEYYYDTHMDHVVPDGGNDFDNFALACKACNFIKSDINFAQGDSSRASVIGRASAYIKEKRDFNRTRLDADLKLLGMLDDIESTSGTLTTSPAPP
jgi:5-methylcytosine-specific restriction endonuclease McrA